MIRDTHTLLAMCWTFIHQLEYSKYNDPYAISHRAEKETYDARVDEMILAMEAVLKTWWDKREKEK